MNTASAVLQFLRRNTQDHISREDDFVDGRFGDADDEYGRVVLLQIIPRPHPLACGECATRELIHENGIGASTMKSVQIDDTDFASMSLAQKIHHFEVEGYIILPQILDVEHIQLLKSELADAPMRPSSYSEAQTGLTDPQWISPAVCALIGHPPTIQFLRALLGRDIVFTLGAFLRTHPGSVEISLHTDGQPHGSSTFELEGTAPRLVRVLYYLDNITRERAAFRCVPRSHICFHADANPYQRYDRHPQQIILCPPAGSALIFPKELFHGTLPNRDTVPREVIQFGYRPIWSGPIHPMPEWDPQDVARAPARVKPFLKSPNTSGAKWELENKPQNMASEAPGMNPSRWDEM